MTISYAVHSAAWALGGFAAGYGAATLGRRAEAAMTEEGSGKRPWRLPDHRTIVGSLAVIIALVGSILYVIQARELAAITQQTADRASCQNELNTEFRKALAARAAANGPQIDAAIAQLEAQDRYIAGLLTTEDPAQQLQDTRDYLDSVHAQISALRAQQEVRQENPVGQLARDC